MTVSADEKSSNDALGSYQPYLNVRHPLYAVMSYIVGSHPDMNDRASSKFVAEPPNTIWQNVQDKDTGVHSLRAGPLDPDYALSLHGLFTEVYLPVDIIDSDRGSFLSLTANAIAGEGWRAAGERLTGRPDSERTSFLKNGEPNPDGINYLLQKVGRNHKGVMSDRPEVRANLDLLNETVRTDFPQNTQLHWEFKPAIDMMGVQSLPEFRISGLNVMQAHQLQKRLEDARIRFEHPPSLDFVNQSIIIHGMNNMLDPMGFVALRAQLGDTPRGDAKGPRRADARFGHGS